MSCRRFRVMLMIPVLATDRKGKCMKTAFSCTKVHRSASPIRKKNSSPFRGSWHGITVTERSIYFTMPLKMKPLYSDITTELKKKKKIQKRAGGRT